MKTITKKLLISILMVLAVFTFSVMAITIKPTKTSAQAPARFEMNEGAYARISNPSGLRFVVTMDEATKTSIANGLTAETAEFGFLIAPNVYFTSQVVTDKDYHNDLFDFVNAQYTKDDANKFYAEKDGDGYCANGVIQNIYDENFELNFTAVAYYKLEGETAYTYADLDATKLSKNITTIASKAYYDANETLKQTIIDIYGLGTSTKPFIVNDALDFEGMVNAGDTANYKLGADIVIDEKEGVNAFNTEFKATLDGGNHVITHNVNRGTTSYNGIFNKISGTIKNVVFDTSIVAGSAGDRTTPAYAIAYSLSGKMENVAFITDFTGCVGYGFFRGLFFYMGNGANITNAVRYDETVATACLEGSPTLYGEGVHLASVAANGSQINNFSYIGISFNNNGYQKVPRDADAATTLGWGSSLGTGNATVNGYYIYQDIIQARAGVGKEVTSITSQTYDNKDPVALYTSFDSKAVSTTLSAPFSVVGKDVKLGDTVVYTPATLNVSTAEQFKTAMQAGREDIINLTDDITLATTDGNTSGTYFGANFIGTLNGNNHTVSIASAVASTTGNNGLFSSISGTIQDVKFDLDYTAWRQNNVVNQGILAETLTGTIKNCIVDVDFGAASTTTRFNSGIVGLLDKGTLENIVYAGTATGTTTSGYNMMSTASYMTAGSTMKNIVILTPDTSSYACFMPDTYNVGVAVAKNSSLASIALFNRDATGSITASYELAIASYQGYDAYRGYQSSDRWYSSSFNKTSAPKATTNLPTAYVTGITISGLDVNFAQN